MTISILNKFKSLAIGLMVFLFFMGVTLNSCTSADKGSENTENLEAASDEEHPEGEGEEHPTEEDEEHPSDSTEEDHPAKEGESEE